MHITFFSLRDGSQGGKTPAEGEIYYGNFKNRTRRHRRHRTHPYRTHQQHASGRQGRCLRRPGERIDVESFVNNKNDYDIKCEIVCDGAVLNMPKPNYISVNTNATTGQAMYTDCFQRFADAYNAEIQTWINASKAGYVDGPTAWDGYCCQVAAAAASKARETQTIQPVVYDEMPDFYKA